MNFDLARRLVAVSRSRDFQQMDKTEIARKRLVIREKLTRNTIWKPWVGLPQSVVTFNLARPLAAVSSSRDFQQSNKTEIAKVFQCIVYTARRNQWNWVAYNNKIPGEIYGED